MIFSVSPWQHGRDVWFNPLACPLCFDPPMDIVVDKDVLLRMVTADGMQLQRGSEQLRNDPGVAKAAVMQNSKASEFVGERLAADHTFWLAMALSTDASDETCSCAWSNIKRPSRQLPFIVDRDAKKPRLGLLDGEDLICHICHDFVTTPISQCTQGHLFCRKCVDTAHKANEVMKCPKCRSPMPNGHIRNLALENIIPTLMGTCPIGCGRVLRLAELSGHAEDECPLRMITCPLCKDRQTFSDFRQHVLSKHGEKHDSFSYEWTAVPERKPQVLPFRGGLIVGDDHIVYWEPVMRVNHLIQVIVRHANESREEAGVAFTFKVCNNAGVVGHVAGISSVLFSASGVDNLVFPSASLSTGGFFNTNCRLTLSIEQLRCTSEATP